MNSGHIANLSSCEEKLVITCPSGYNYNSVTDKCQRTPETGYLCTKGIYNSVTQKCEVTPDTGEFGVSGQDGGDSGINPWFLIIIILILLGVIFKDKLR